MHHLSFHPPYWILDKEVYLAVQPLILEAVSNQLSRLSAAFSQIVIGQPLWPVSKRLTASSAHSMSGLDLHEERRTCKVQPLNVSAPLIGQRQLLCQQPQELAVTVSKIASSSSVSSEPVHSVRVDSVQFNPTPNSRSQGSQCLACPCPCAQGQYS